MLISKTTAPLLALLLAASAYGVENVKVSGGAKYWYQTTVKDTTSNDFFQQESSVGVAAVELGVSADLMDGLKGKASVIGLDSLGLEQSFVKDISSAGAGRENGDNYYRTQIWLSEANLDYKISNTSVIIGRQALNTPLLFTERWNASYNTFDAAVLINSDLPYTTLVAGYVHQHNGGASAGNATATAQVIVSAAPPPAGLPVISAFTANPGTIIAGNSSILSWNVSNANIVTIDHGVGVVASTGNASVSPVTTTSYTLTATNASGWSNVTIQVVVNPALPPPIAMVEVFPVIAESGYVRSNGNPWPNYIYVGDDNNDISIQGFISFDISAIPAGATITNVKVDFTNYASAMGDPFGSLGTLRFYAHNYGVLDGSDYYAGPPPAGYILYYNSAGSIAVHDAPLVKNALQAKVGSSRFQMRLQFNVATDSNGDNDIMRWMTSYVPKLIVTFTVP